MKYRANTRLGFGLLVLVGTLAQDCGTGIDVVHRFELSSCPGETYSLPNSVEDGRYRLSDVTDHKISRGYGMCPGFRVYQLLENGNNLLYYRVRINHAQSCSIDVGYGYRGNLSEEPVREIEDETTPLVEVVAQLVLQDANITPTVPAAKVERFYNRKGVKEWCGQATDAE